MEGPVRSAKNSELQIIGTGDPQRGPFYLAFHIVAK